MIDFHCHLDLYPNPSQVVERCSQESIFVLSVTTTPSAYPGTLALAGATPRIETALGLHPQLAAERHREVDLFDDLVDQVAWVGEIGLDGAPEFSQFWDRQVEVFRHLLSTCTREGGRVLSIHSRRAASEVLLQLREFPNAGLPVLHWFSGSKAELLQFIDLGCWFSVGLPMLKAKRAQSLVALMPRDRILPETDGPFVQNGHGPAYPWDTWEVEHALAKVWCVSEIDARFTLQSNLDCVRAHRNW